MHSTAANPSASPWPPSCPVVEPFQWVMTSGAPSPRALPLWQSSQLPLGMKASWVALLVSNSWGWQEVHAEV